METTTIIAIIIGIITVITVVVVIVIQNKKPTPSPPTTDCEWMEGKWEIDNNTQMNLQDTNYPEECSVVPHNCGNWKRDVKCTSSNGVGNCTDDDCTKTRPVDHINCGPCPSPPPPPPPPPAGDIIKVGDKVKLFYYSHGKKWHEFTMGGLSGKWVSHDETLASIPILTVFVDGKQLGEPVTQQDKITLKYVVQDIDIIVLSRWKEYLYLADATKLDSSYITKFYIITKDTTDGTNDILMENTDYILQDAVDTGNFLDDYSKSGYSDVVFKLRDDPSFVPRIIKLQKV